MCLLPAFAIRTPNTVGAQSIETLDVRFGQKQTFAVHQPCLLYPRKRHQMRRMGMSAMGQKRTLI